MTLEEVKEVSGLSISTEKLLVYMCSNIYYVDVCICYLAITGAIRGSSREKLYHELGLETLQQRRWYRKLCCFYKILKSQSPKYLYSIIPIHNMSYRTRQYNKIPATNGKHDFFKNTFFLQQ